MNTSPPRITAESLSLGFDPESGALLSLRDERTGREWLAQPGTLPWRIHLLHKDGTETTLPAPGGAPGRASFAFAAQPPFSLEEPFPTVACGTEAVPSLASGEDRRGWLCW
ncbi:MAG: hypothetical protein QHJ73_00955, partial [Armatimonadota bacterium]|nr:hypothetical protein [Armatimonadota bacterium]